MLTAMPGKPLALVAGLLLVPAFSIGTCAQQVETKAAPSTPKAKQTPTRATILQALQEAAASANDLKDARSKAGMFMAIAAARARLGEHASAETCIKQAIQAANAIEDPLQRTYTLKDVAGVQIDCNDRAGALATMRDAFDVASTIADDHQRNTTRMWIVATVARAGDVDAALRVVGEFPESSFYKSHAIPNVLEGLNHSNPLSVKAFLPKLLQVVAAIPNPGVQATCLQVIAEQLADARDLPAVRSIAEILHNGGLQLDPRGGSQHIFLDCEALTLSALAKAAGGQREDALRSFENAVKIAERMPPEGEALRSSRLGRIAHDRAEAGDIEGALRTADSVMYEYFKSTAVTSIAAAKAKAGKREQARALFGVAIQTAKEIKSRDPLRDRAESHYLNSRECLRTIAYAQARAGFVEDAIHTAETIDEPRWKNSAFAQIAMAMAKAGEISPARRLVERIDDENLKSRALQDVAEGQAESGDIPGAVEWAKSRPPPEARANALLGIVRAIANKLAAGEAP